MWKTIAIIGGIVAAGMTFALWCALKAGSDEDDFWGIGDETTEEFSWKGRIHEKG